MRRSAALLAATAALTALVALSPVAVGPAAAADLVVAQPGDTLWGIAERQGTTVLSLVTLNRIRDPNWIVVGQQIRVRRAAGPVARRARVATPRVHVVAPGETLTGIARRYATTIAAIVNANSIADRSMIWIGMRLVIPSAPAAATNASPRPRLAPSAAQLAAARAWVRQLIVREARRYHVPTALALGLAWQESGWQQGVVSSAGAVGVMQLLPSTAKWVGDAMLHRYVSIRDTRANVRAGVRLLSFYLHRYAGDRRRALAAYYQGMSSVDRRGVLPISHPYIASILVLETVFGG